LQGYRATREQVEQCIASRSITDALRADIDILDRLIDRILRHSSLAKIRTQRCHDPIAERSNLKR
jgi:hypothetical protein